jgi:hypothetical protein
MNLKIIKTHLMFDSCIGLLIEVTMRQLFPNAANCYSTLVIWMLQGYEWVMFMLSW